MKEQRIAFALLLLVCAGFAVALMLRPSREPEDVVQACIQAGMEGDGRAYRGFFGGDMADELRTAQREQGGDAFSRNLKQRLSPLVGVAVTRPGDPPGGDRALVRVELIYPGRNEIQKYLLEPRGRSWRIVDVQRASSNRMPIPYGTPVIPEEYLADEEEGASPDGGPGREQGTEEP